MKAKSKARKLTEAELIHIIEHLERTGYRVLGWVGAQTSQVNINESIDPFERALKDVGQLRLNKYTVMITKKRNQNGE